MISLTIKDLHVSVDDKEILKGISLTLEKGKIHALMGPNGSGKSSLANALMGHPKYQITSGQIILNGKDITELEPNERSLAGLFLSFQYPQEIQGLSIQQYLRSIVNAHRKKPLSILEFRKILDETMKVLHINPELKERYVNAGFSGGEKKRFEILQMSLLDPNVCILDETDSGLDIDALRAVADGINDLMNTEKSMLLITHYKRILELVRPDKVFVLKDGKIIHEADGSFVDELESKGYGWLEE